MDENMIRIERNLCETGAELNEEIDNQITAARAVGAQSSDKIHTALKNYFNHRAACPTCKVAIWINGQKLT